MNAVAQLSERAKAPIDVDPSLHDTERRRQSFASGAAQKHGRKSSGL